MAVAERDLDLSVEELESVLAAKRAKQNRERAEAEERRQAAYREFDQATVDAFDRSALDQAVRDAEQRLREAVLRGEWANVRDAFVAANVAYANRSHSVERAKTAYTNLGVALHTVGLNSPTPVGGGVTWSTIESILSAEMTRLSEDANDAAAQARMDAGNAAAAAEPVAKRRTAR